MTVCLVLGGVSAHVALAAFTLSWTHSVERVRWEEDWRLEPAGFVLVESRIKGSGAGMEVPDGAVLADGAWTYRPTLPPQAGLLLARSGTTGGGWTLCADGACREFGTEPGAPAEIRRCREG